MLSSTCYTIGDGPLISVEGVSVSSHNDSVRVNVAINAECVEAATPRAAAIICDGCEVVVVNQFLVDEKGSSTRGEIHLVDHEVLRTRDTSADEAVACTIKLDIVERKRYSRLIGTVSRIECLKEMFTSNRERIKHRTGSSIYANERTKRTVDEVHNTILSSHTANKSGNTRLISFIVILYSRDYPLVLKGIFAISTTSRIVVLILNARYDMLNTSHITYKLILVKESKDSANINLITYLEGRINRHSVALQRIHTIRYVWVVIRVERSNLQAHE